MKIGFIVAILGFVFCAAMAISTLRNNTATPQEATERVEAMTYQVDSRTGLCFAVFCWHDETRSVSNVPCTAEVLARIGR